MDLKPNDFLHSKCSQYYSITFNVCRDTIVYLPKFVYHAKIFNEPDVNYIGDGENKHLTSKDTKLRGRLYPDQQLIALHILKDILNDNEIDLFHELVNMYIDSTCKIYIGSHTENIFEDLPEYSLNYIKKWLRYKKLCRPDHIMHTCDPIVKRFIKRSMYK